MFEKLVEKLVAKRLNAIEARIDNLLQGAVEQAVERALANRQIVRHEDLKLALDPVKNSLLTEEKIKEFARAEIESVVEDSVSSALNEYPQADAILTNDDFRPEDFDILTKDNFDPDDYDLVTKDNVGEVVDTDEVTSQVVEKIQDALSSLKQ